MTDTPTAVITEIRAGEENDGPLESVDLFVEGRGLSLLVNVTVAGRVTFALGVDGTSTQSGTVHDMSSRLQLEPIIMTDTDRFARLRERLRIQSLTDQSDPDYPKRTRALLEQIDEYQPQAASPKVPMMLVSLAELTDLLFIERNEG